MAKQRGQILLIVVLVVIVASTIGLSIASRSITGLRTSTEEAESQKALAAAEAGIERAIQGSTLAIGSSDLTTLDNNSNYKTTVDSVDSSKFLINEGGTLLKNEGADVWFVDHNPDGSLIYGDETTLSTNPSFLNLYWGLSSDGCNEAAIEAVIVTSDPALLDTDPNKIKTYRYTYDGCSGRRTGNNFTGAELISPHLVGKENFNIKSKEGDLTSGIVPPGNKHIILMRVIPIYKDAIVGIEACDKGGGNCTMLPSPGYKITSIGKSGQANRKITVFKGYPQSYLPYLSYGLFVAAD